MYTNIIVADICKSKKKSNKLTKSSAQFSVEAHCTYAKDTIVLKQNMDLPVMFHTLCVNPLDNSLHRSLVWAASRVVPRCLFDFIECVPNCRSSHESGDYEIRGVCWPRRGLQRRQRPHAIVGLRAETSHYYVIANRCAYTSFCLFLLTKLNPCNFKKQFA